MSRTTDGSSAAVPRVSAPGDTASDAPSARPARWSQVRPRLLWVIGVALAGTGLFACYLRQARIAAVNSDGASIALQAWDMLHGNLLLHGWWVADVTFYTTELPEYMLVESVHGLRPDVVDICAALTYTLLVVLAALLARGRARGREGVVRALLAAGIMLAPGIARGTYVVLTEPNHTGTAVPILLILLLLDRLSPGGSAASSPQASTAGGSGGSSLQASREHWYVPVLVCVLLTWVQVADVLATVAVAVPLAAVAAVRAAARIRRSQAAWWYDMSLAVAAAVSYPLARVAQAVLRAHGGYSQAPLSSRLIAPTAVLPGHFHAVADSVLLLFGADFFHQPSALLTALAFLHFAALALAAGALLAGILFFARLDRVSQILVVGIFSVLAAGVLSMYVTGLSGAHQIAVVLPFGATLAGRLVGPRLARARLEPLLAVGLACYLASLCYAATWAPSFPQNQALADWLVDHNLTEGLASYWQASSTTVDSGGRVTVAALAPGGMAPYHWQSNSAWYDPRSHYANFVVAATRPDEAGEPVAVSTERRLFGRPSRTYRFEDFTIMVWDKNLLITLARGHGGRTGR